MKIPWIRPLRQRRRSWRRPSGWRHFGSSARRGTESWRGFSGCCTSSGSPWWWGSDWRTGWNKNHYFQIMTRCSILNIFFWCAPFGYLYFSFSNVIELASLTPSSIRRRGSNPQPLSCESSPLTTRPQLSP
jgi:hypothetical protein